MKRRTFTTSVLSTARRRVGAAIAGFALLLHATAALAIDPTPTNTFQNGERISSSRVNQNFSELYQAVAALEARVTELEGQVMPIGTIAFFAINFTPEGWLPCDGRSMTVADNTALYSLLGTYYGGNGSTEFRLPDLRGRMPLGTGTDGELANHTLGQRGGAETFTLSTSNLPEHQHTLPISSVGGDVGSPPALVAQPTVSGDIVTTVETGPVGSAAPVPIQPPYLALSCFIRVTGPMPVRGN